MKKVIIIGSGVAGATIAKELAHLDCEILVLEKGDYFNDFGTMQILYNYDGYGRATTEGGIIINRTFMVGGSGVVALGNGIRTLDAELKTMGINLDHEYQDAERELGVTAVPPSHIGERTRRIMEASKEMGLNMRPMPKFIDFEKCVGCGLCHFGCAYGAKWTPLQYLEEAKSRGVDILTGMVVEEISGSPEGKKSVKGIGPKGEFELFADVVVLAAGAIDTAIVLQRSGVSTAGENFFIDIYNVTLGTIDNVKMQDELQMSAVITDFHKTSGFVLSPYIHTGRKTLSYSFPLLDEKKEILLENTLGIMTKITDESSGRVTKEGAVKKGITQDDWKKLKEGADLSKKILIKAGCHPESIFTTNTEGAHQGGTASIGRVVDMHLEAEIKGLYVCDASVLPSAPGAPPVLAIVALSKRLAMNLKEVLSN